MLGLLPSGGRSLEELPAFNVEYTLFLNVLAGPIAGVLVLLSRRAHRAAGPNQPVG